jgi:hypothetical protein
MLRDGTNLIASWREETGGERSILILALMQEHTVHMTCDLKSSGTVDDSSVRVWRPLSDVIKISDHPPACVVCKGPLMHITVRASIGQHLHVPGINFGPHIRVRWNSRATAQKQ